MTKILFRCDASPAVGMGHLRRCLTLAKEMKRHGVFVFFLCRAEKLNWENEVSVGADEWAALEWNLTPEADARALVQIYHRQKMDAAIIDHYRADVAYQQYLYHSGIKWLQFDWAARQPLWADWVINASPSAKESAYLPRKKRNETHFLLGPSYAILREEFSLCRKHVKFRERVQKILFTFGGGDDRGATKLTLEATESLCRKIERIVILSTENPNFPNIVKYIKKNYTSNITVVVNEKKIAKRMAQADLAVVAGGTTTFETIMMGLSTLIIQIAENQKGNAMGWANCGVAVDLGRIDKISMSKIRNSVKSLIENPNARRTMFGLAHSLVDGIGSKRITKIMLE